MSHSPIRKIVVRWFSIALVFTIALGGGLLAKAERPNPAKLLGQPADIAPSAYQYRADRNPEANPPESWIGLMKYARLPFDKAVAVSAPAWKKVLCGLIWEEVRRVRRVALVWNGAPQRRPKADEIVLTYFDAEAAGKIPTWWNETVLREAGEAEVSADGNTYTFAIPVDTFGLVVSVRGQADASTCEVPAVRAFGPDLWKKMDLEIEWAFDKATAASDYSGRIEAYDGIVERVRPLAGDAGTTMEGACNWASRPQGNGRRGVRMSLLYLGTSKWRKVWPYNSEPEDVARTIITVWTNAGNCSFLAADLEKGPILAPEYSFFVRASKLSPAQSTEETSKALLGQKMNSFLGSRAIRGWHTGNDTPWFAGNATDRSVTVEGITFPARGVAMHPGADCDVAIGWRSPIEGRVSLRAKVAHAQPGGGDGIEWSVVLAGSAGRKSLARGTIDRGGAQSIPPKDDVKRLAEIAVRREDVLSLVVGRRGDHFCDSTAIELVISEIGAQAHTWNLARDVVNNVQSGNPHNDSLGNPGVWSFLQTTPPSLHQPPFEMNSQASSAREFIQELAAKHRATIRQRVRQHPEQTWDGAVAAMFPGKTLPAIPKPEFDTPMKVEVPCEKLSAQWNLGAWHMLRHAVKNDKGQLRFNDHPYGILAAETYLVLRALDLMGMHKEAADGLDQWLSLPLQNKKPVGLFCDGDGCLTQAVGPPGAGGNMDGVHGMGPGAIMFALTEHFRLTGDGEWLKAGAPRMKANVEWILRQRRLLAGVVPGGDRLWCKGLQPAHQVTPDSGGQLMQFYESEGYYWLAVQRFAQILRTIDPAEGTRLAAEAEAYRMDLKTAVERSIALSPVVLVRDGTYRSFIPFACYVRGFASGAWSWRRPGSGAHVGGLYWDTIQSAESLVSPAGLLSPDDRRVQGTLDVLEDRLLLENPKVAQRTQNFDPEKHWFAHAAWQYQPGLERHANIHLAADDAANFLRSWLNQYAVILLPENGYVFREHTVGGPPDKIFEEAAFLERFRLMLVMEEGNTLWLARAAPRAWFAQGKRISVKNSPTHFGSVGYAIISDADNGKIAASVQMPSRNPPKSVLLRFRHPNALPMKSVTVNGSPWTDFDPVKEVISLHDVLGTIKVESHY
jgi:hypothetical protein